MEPAAAMPNNDDKAEARGIVPEPQCFLHYHWSLFLSFSEKSGSGGTGT